MDYEIIERAILLAYYKLLFYGADIQTFANEVIRILKEYENG